METEAIIAAIRSNDSTKLFTGLYRIAFPPILQHIKQKRGTKLDAEDCFQEAVLVLVKKVQDGSFNAQFEVKNFLFILARNSWYNKLKKNAKMSSGELEDYHLEDDNVGIEEVMVDDARQEAIKKMLDLVGEKCKELLKLMIFENKKVVEVMSIMNISSDEVVRTTHYRCKNKLKEIVSQDRNLLLALRGE